MTDDDRVRLDEISRKLDLLIEAFPRKDIEGHRRYHESIIEWRILRNRMLRSILQKMVEAGSLAGFGWLLYALWTMAKFEVRK